jgi:hypothetical protein
MTELYTLSANKYTSKEMNTALREVHKMKKVISIRMKGGDVVYSVFKEKKIKIQSQEDLQQQNDFKKYRQRLEDEYNTLCSTLTPKQLAHVDSIFNEVGELVEVGNSLVPKNNVEHYKKVLNAPRRTRAK